MGKSNTIEVNSSCHGHRDHSHTAQRDTEETFQTGVFGRDCVKSSYWTGAPNSCGWILIIYKARYNSLFLLFNPKMQDRRDACLELTRLCIWRLAQLWLSIVKPVWLSCFAHWDGSTLLQDCNTRLWPSRVSLTFHFVDQCTLRCASTRTMWSCTRRTWPSGLCCVTSPASWLTTHCYRYAQPLLQRQKSEILHNHNLFWLVHTCVVRLINQWIRMWQKCFRFSCGSLFPFGCDALFYTVWLRDCINSHCWCFVTTTGGAICWLSAACKWSWKDA